MDAEPVAIPSDAHRSTEAEQEFFLRYGWPWFPVVDPGGRLVGVVTPEAPRASRRERRAAGRLGDGRDDGERPARPASRSRSRTLLGREGLAGSAR